MSASRLDVADDEAAFWLVALEDDPDNAELRARFVSWRDASADHAAAWAATSDIHAMMAALAPVSIASTVASKRARRHRPWQKLALLAVAACLAMAALPGLLVTLRADQITATGQSRSFPLGDGSTVHLGGDSALAVDFTQDGRGVTLLRGEAFFEVVADPQRPFTVKAHGVETTVLGTAFNVRLEEDGATVAVGRGSVRVADVRTSERLGPGQWVRLRADGRPERGSLPLAEVASWREGQIVARDRPVAEVVNELRRYFPGAIVLADQELGERRISGVYNIADPVVALEAVLAPHGGKLRTVSPWLLLISARAVTHSNGSQH